MTNLSRKLTNNGLYYALNMKASMGNARFASLFKKYRLRSEISTLSEFGDLLAQEGLVYETSLFTRWQNGERIIKDRRILLAIIKVFCKRGGISTIDEANQIMESSAQGYLTNQEEGDMGLSFNSIPFKFPIANFGNLIREYRIKNNFSQQEISLSLGWKTTEKFNSIEEELIDKPTRDILEQISKVLKLQEQEKNNLLLVGNYLPTEKDIEDVRKEVEPLIESFPYPAVLYDFCWRVILINRKNMDLLGITEEGKRSIYVGHPSAIEIVFDPNFIQNKFLVGEELDIWHNNLLRFITHFRSLQKSIVKDAWYIEMIQNMMKNKLFRKVWMESQEKNTNLIVTRSGSKVFVHPNDNKKRLNFNISVTPLLKDPRFELEYFHPANVDTFNYFMRINNM